MSETTQAEPGQAPAPPEPGQAPTPPAETPTPQAGNPAPEQPPAEAPAAPASGDGPPEPEPQAGGDEGQIERLRSEAAATRRKLREAEAERDELKNAQLSEQQRVEKERDDLKAKAATQADELRDLTVRNAAIIAATTEGYKNPADAVAHLNEPSMRSRIEFDDDGVPKNVGALVKEIAGTRDYLLGERLPPPPETPEPGAPAKPREGDPKPETDEQRRKRLSGGGGGVWANPAAHGGGVVLPPTSGQ